MNRARLILIGIVALIVFLFLLTYILAQFGRKDTDSDQTVVDPNLEVGQLSENEQPKLPENCQFYQTLSAEDQQVLAEQVYSITGSLGTDQIPYVCTTDTYLYAPVLSSSSQLLLCEDSSLMVLDITDNENPELIPVTMAAGSNSCETILFWNSDIEGDVVQFMGVIPQDDTNRTFQMLTLDLEKATLTDQGLCEVPSGSNTNTETCARLRALFPSFFSSL